MCRDKIISSVSHLNGRGGRTKIEIGSLGYLIQCSYLLITSNTAEADTIIPLSLHHGLVPRQYHFTLTRCQPIHDAVTIINVTAAAAARLHVGAKPSMAVRHTSSLWSGTVLTDSSQLCWWLALTKILSLYRITSWGYAFYTVNSIG